MLLIPEFALKIIEITFNIKLTLPWFGLMEASLMLTLKVRRNAQYPLKLNQVNFISTS